MKYKITEITTQEMKVEYEDGSWAKIASSPDQPKEYYLTMIARYHNSNDQEVAIADHPMKIGDEGVVGEGITKEEETEIKFDYGAVRIHLYPSNEQQWDAAYHTRKGDNTLQTKLDAHIEMVKDKVPADDKIYTVKELEALSDECLKDPAWVSDV